MLGLSAGMKQTWLLLNFNIRSPFCPSVIFV